MANVLLKYFRLYFKKKNIFKPQNCTIKYVKFFPQIQKYGIKWESLM